MTPATSCQSPSRPVPVPPRVEALDREIRERFESRYGSGALAEGRLLAASLGRDLGQTGYTDWEQALEIEALLDVGPGRRLLDLGCGRGWQGRTLAERTGATVYGVDLPLAALDLARAEGLGLSRGRFGAVRGDAGRLPFADRSLHGIVHSDVLC